MNPADIPTHQWNTHSDSYSASAIRRYAFAACAISVILFVVHIAFETKGSLLDLVTIPIGLAVVSLFSTVIAALRSQGDRRTGWLFLAAAALAWCAGHARTDTFGIAHKIVDSGAHAVFVISIVCGLLLLTVNSSTGGKKFWYLLNVLPLFLALVVANWVLVIGERLSSMPDQWTFDSLSLALHGVGFATLVTVGVVGIIERQPQRLTSPSRFIFLAPILLAVGDPIWSARWTSWVDISTKTSHIIAGTGFALIGFAALIALVRQPLQRDVTTAEQRTIPGIGISFVLQYLSLGGLLVLAAALASIDEPAPHGQTIVHISAIGLLCFIVARQSIIVRRDRVLEHHIGELTGQLDGLISQVGRDPLTGLFNHRAVHERLDAELLAGRTGGRSVAIVLIDVDNFKSINDTLGHQAGDRVLRAVSTILVSACRASDVAARYAGDEFMLILPGLDERHAASVCERISQEVRRLNQELRLGGGLRVTLSVGVAVTHLCLRSVVHNIAIADAAMYDAKEGGKNQVVVVNADTLQISPPLIGLPTVDQLMAASLASMEFAEQRSDVG